MTELATQEYSSTEIISEEPPVVEEMGKPVRKRAPRKVRTGLPKGMRIQIHPTPEQAQKLGAWAGSGRWVWNWALARQTEHYAQTCKQLSSNQLSRDLTKLLKDKTKPESEWLDLVPRTCLTRVLNNLQESWQAFFDGFSGKRPEKPGQPQFKCKNKTQDSACFQIDPRHKNPVRVSDKMLCLAGIGPVPATFTESVPGVVSEISVRQKGGEWFASLTLVDIPPKQLMRKPKKTRQFSNPMDPMGVAALDASVVHCAVGTSDGETTYVLMSEADRARDDAKRARKKRYQRMQCRQLRHRLQEAGVDPKKQIPKGTRLPKSNRQKKIDYKVAGCELGILFARNDRIHKFTTDLVRNHHTIVVETLVLSAMAQSLTRGFRRRMHEAAMGELVRQLKYKCTWYDRKLIFVDKWFPSSKRCSNTACHKKNSELKLKDRAWICPHCQTQHARDDNAAFNLWQEGWRLLEEQALSCSTVGSTVAARGAGASQSGDIVPVEGLPALKRETSRKTLALSVSHSGMDPELLTAG